MLKPSRRLADNIQVFRLLRPNSAQTHIAMRRFISATLLLFGILGASVFAFQGEIEARIHAHYFCQANGGVDSIDQTDTERVVECESGDGFRTPLE